MKLVFSGNTAWSMYNFRRKVFMQFIADGHEVYVIAPHDEQYELLLTQLGCKFIPINMERKGTNPIKDFLLYTHYRNILKQIKPDGCFFYTIKPNIYGGMASSALHIPYIPITTGLGYIFNTQSIISKVAKTLYKVAFKKAEQVWFLNQEDINSFIQANLIPSNQAKLLKGEGIDTTYFQMQQDKNGPVSFLLFARILWDKGVGIYVDAAKKIKERYPDVRFELLGTIDVDNPMGIPKSQIDEWHQKGYIVYLGHTSDVRPFISQSSCVVLPSFYREGIPLCLMEGAASGKPLITTNHTGCKEVVDDGYNGFLCEPKDVDSLVKAMEKILQMTDEERRQMGLHGREKMEKEFNIDLIVDEYNKAISHYFMK